MQVLKNVTKLLIIAGLALGFATRASANTTWYLVNVTFNNGNTATGSFTVNATNNAYVSFSIVVSGPASADAFTVTQMVDSYLPGEIGMANPGFSKYVDLFLMSNLTSAGGTIPLTSGVDCPVGCGTLLLGAGPEITTIPEPATGGLMLLGFGMMMRKRIAQRRQRATATNHS